MIPTPAIFLDRDGILNHTVVINNTPHPPQTISELKILPRVPEALTKLASLNLPLIVVTNQPDVARGTQSQEAVEQINDALRISLPQLTEFYTCFHDTPDNCLCRKPLPGLLTEAARAYNIDLARSFMVGDRWSDIAAGQAAGCKSILIDLPYSKADRCTPDFRAADLSEAVEIILRELHRT
jgi:D-glycero-D-manno-heptose 1,7-bisphosphate phosphatase